MKRILLFAFLLLALAVPAWGVARTLYPAQDAMNWSAAEWSLADDNAKNQAKPAGGDTVYFAPNSGDVTLDENSAALATFSADGYVGTLALGANTLTVDGVCYLDSTITGTGTIDAGEGTFYQYATVANTVNLLLTTSGSHAIYWGGSGGSVNINATGTYTLTTDCDSYALTVTAGTLAGNSQTWTVGAGDFTFTNGTISGTLGVDLSGAAGAYAQTAGTIDTGAVLNVTTGTGGFSWTALTRTGTLNIVAAANANGKWASSYTGAGCISKLTINTGVTLTQNGALRVAWLDGPDVSAVLAGGIQTTIWHPGANEHWSFNGTIAGTGLFRITPTATPLTIAAVVNVGSTRAVNFSSDVAPRVLTISGLICGNLTVTSGGAGTSSLTINGNSSGAAIALGSVANKYGVVNFGAGYVHRWTGAIARGGTGTANAFTIGGRLILDGTFTGTGITTSVQGDGQIDCFGAGRVTAVTSTGRRLVVRRAVDASGNPVRSWNGDGCTNVRFLGRRLVGSDN